MILGKRREAARLVAAAGLDIRADATSEVISMLVRGAKQYGAMMRGAEVSIPTNDAMLVAAAGRAMAENHTAIDRLSEVMGSTALAMPILHRVQEAAEDSLVANRPPE